MGRFISFALGCDITQQHICKHTSDPCCSGSDVLQRSDESGVLITWKSQTTVYGVGTTETELSFIQFSSGMLAVLRNNFGAILNVDDSVHMLRYFHSNFNGMNVTNIPETYTFEIDPHDARRALDQRRKDYAPPDDASEDRHYVYLSDRFRDEGLFWAKSLAAFFPTARTTSLLSADTDLEFLIAANQGWTVCSRFRLDGHAIAVMYKPAGTGISAYCIVCRVRVQA